MNPIFLQIALIITGQLVGAIITIYLVRWRKREEEPEKLSERIEELAKQVVTLRGQIKYIEGRLNGKFWKNEA